MDGVWKISGKTLTLNRVYVMGILNVTPDSFSDGGKYLREEDALRRALEMAREGADILDVGGQSTRPGFTQIPPEEEWSRICGILPRLVRETGLPVSVDTFYPQVARWAAEAGASVINDVRGAGAEMLKAVAGTDCGLIVMYPQGGGGKDVCRAARAFFEERLMAAEQVGVAGERLCFDPGIGFGKTYAENLRLLGGTETCRVPGRAYLMAASRKRVVGAPCGDPPFSERMPATLAAHTAAILDGADLIRVHDVKEGVQAAKMARAIRDAKE